MRLFDEFKAEHVLVDRVAGSLIRFAELAAGGESSEEDVADFVHFFRVFVAGYHHQKEEQTLFPVLVETAEGQAFHDGYWTNIGGEEFATQYVDRLIEVTAEEIQQAAALYLGSGVHVTAVVLPE